MRFALVERLSVILKACKAIDLKGPCIYSDDCGVCIYSDDVDILSFLERLPRLQFKPYKDFAPRPTRPPSGARPAFQKPVFSGERKGKGVRFSNEETEFLRAGIIRFGDGHWKEILQYYPFHPSRTSTSLKDRARNMKGRIQ